MILFFLKFIYLLLVYLTFSPWGLQRHDNILETKCQAKLLMSFNYWVLLLEL